MFTCCADSYRMGDFVHVTYLRADIWSKSNDSSLTAENRWRYLHLTGSL